MHQMIYEHGNSITQWIFIRKLRGMLLFVISVHCSLSFTYTWMLQAPTQAHASIPFNSTKMGSKPLFVRVNIKSRTTFVDSETGHTFKMKNRFPFVAAHVALHAWIRCKSFDWPFRFDWPALLECLTCTQVRAIVSPCVFHSTSTNTNTRAP